MKQMLTFGVMASEKIREANAYLKSYVIKEDK